MRSNAKTIAALLLAGTLGLAAVPLAAQQPASYRLTLKDAIELALRANLNVLVGATRVDEATGASERSRAAAVLPRVNMETYANAQNRDLRAFGLSLPGIPIPSVVGPFSNYDFRVYAQQNVIDLASYRNWKASEMATNADKMDLEDARDMIVRAVAGLYLNAQSAEARAASAQSRVTDSETLAKLAKDKHDAGTATGVDVLRAQVQLANDRQALLIEQNAVRLALLELERNLGMEPGTPVELTEPLVYRALNQETAEALTSAALAARADYRSLAEQRSALVEQQKANQARWYPKVSVNGNFGGIGRSIGGVQATGLIQGQVDFTVFDRDREGESVELASRLRRIDDQVADLRRGVDEDLRAALLNLDSAAGQVAVAEQGQELAKRELQEARDRFDAGTANNVEVVTAQDELARAEENYILAVSSHVDAKYALARAEGDTEQNILRYSASQ